MLAPGNTPLLREGLLEPQLIVSIQLSQMSKAAVTLFHLQEQCRDKLCGSLQQDQEQKTPGIVEVAHLSPVTTTGTSFELSALRKPVLEFPKRWAWLDCLALEITRGGTCVALKVF